MRFFVFVVLIISAVFAAQNGGESLFPSDCGQIMKRDHVGPQGALGEFPWLVVLDYDTIEGKQLIGGGVLISDQYVLTNAHCLKYRASDLLSVRLGENDLSKEIDCQPHSDKDCADPTKSVAVEAIIRHEGYDGDTATTANSPHDIALLRLKTKVNFSKYIKPICLPKDKPSQNEFTAAGWSLTKPDQSDVQYANILHEVQDCAKNPRLPFVTKEHVCAGLPNENACIVDNGGPLMGFEKKQDGSIRQTVFGVSYFDLPCNLSTLPGVFTRVSDYVPWMMQHVTA